MNSSPIVIGRPFFAGGFLYNSKTRSVLLHKRDGNTNINPYKWAFFGGSSEGNETPEECLIRELKEELSLTVDKKDLHHLCSYHNSHHDRDRHVFYIHSELQKSYMVLGEGADFDWIPLDRVVLLDLTDSTRRDLKTFKEKI